LCFDAGDLLRLRVERPLLALNFIKQHRRELVVLHGLKLPVAVVGHQIRIDFSYLFGDQPRFERLAAIGGFLVMIGHGPQVQEAAAVSGHILDVFLEAGGGVERAELAVAVDKDCHGIGNAGLDAPDPGDEGAGLVQANTDDVRFCILARMADVDIVGPRLEVKAGQIADRSVARTYAGIKRPIAEGGVAAAGTVVKERKATFGGVAAAGAVEIKSPKAARGVEVPGVVIYERGDAAGGVVPAGGVGLERFGAAGGVAVAGGVGIERTGAAGGVAAAGSVESKRVGAARGVSDAGSVVLERFGAAGGVKVAGSVSNERGVAGGGVIVGRRRCRGEQVSH